jgi:hypothetical protein
MNRYMPAFASRQADILLGHRNYFQRKDYAELRECILRYEHEVLPVHFQSSSSQRIPSLRAIQCIIVLIMYLLLLPLGIYVLRNRLQLRLNEKRSVLKRSSLSCTVPFLASDFAFQVSAGYRGFVSSLQHLTSLSLLRSSAIFLLVAEEDCRKN